MITLYKFQQDASDQIAQRIAEFTEHPIRKGRGDELTTIPFVQFLSSLTASGKTIILADAMAQIAAQVAIAPVVLWLSKLTVVVEQSFGKLDEGGEYNELIPDFLVRALSELAEDELSTFDNPFLFFATTGKFNQRDKEGRKVFASRLDDASTSIWDTLTLRTDKDGIRRPLIVVYDEAHNLSAQQTRLLLDLEPDAFILATATTRIPAEFSERILEPLKQMHEVEEQLLWTDIPPSEVAKTGLVKLEVGLIGQISPMEQVVSDMVKSLRATQADAKKAGLDKRPKAVYVCRTNITEADDKQFDDPKQPFKQRQAPPILIWRHLVETLKIDPTTIAAYCDLKVDPDFQLPKEFMLFKGRDTDYEEFISGDYEHIIFNQSLQEGWDEPFVYFAYIDRTLGSTIAAEQIVGRLLRQPGRQHYSSDRLNRAQVHVRVQEGSVFEEVVSRTQAKLADDQTPVVLRVARPGKKLWKPLPPKGSWIVPAVATHSEDAVEDMAKLVDQAPTFEVGGPNTEGVGRKTMVQRRVGDKSSARFEWQEIGSSARVTARWLFSRELRRYHKDAASAVMLDKPKWDAKVGVGSPAAGVLASLAKDVGECFLDESYVEVAECDDDDYEVGDAFSKGSKLERFDNSVHLGYDSLNLTLELPFARELDALGHTWARNPSGSGFGIPLIERGVTDTFYPDFLVWLPKGDVVALDTKGLYLKSDAERKLVRLKQASGRPKVLIRFVLQGCIDKEGRDESRAGFTVLRYKDDGTKQYKSVKTLEEATKTALK